MKVSQNNTFDVVIIGAGVVGASIALGLAKRGLKTLNVDTLPAAGYGSTSNSSAIIRPFYSAIESCALAHEARSRWLKWPEFLNADDESGHARYTECGMLILVAEEDKKLFQPSLEAMQSVGVAFEHLTVDEIGKQFRFFNTASFSPPRLTGDPGFGISNKTPLAGGYDIAAAGYVSDPQLATHNLQRAAEALGAVFIFNTRVTAIERSSGRVTAVTTHHGEKIEAPVIINAAGPHSSKINSLAGIADAMTISTHPLRHEAAHVPAPAGFGHGSDQINRVIGDSDTGVYMRPELGGNMLIGSLDPACDAKDFVNADHYNNTLTEQWTQQVWRAAQRIPSLCIPNIAQGVVGLYDATPDWIPIYDKSPLPGFYMAIGTSGNQFKNAPVIGDLMATLVTACEAGHDHDNDPVKFHLPALQRTIDLGFFSRNRELHAESSGTVLA